MGKRTSLAVGACLVIVLTGCGVKISPGAVTEVAGSAAKTVKLGGDDVTHLAGKAGVDESLVRDTAPRLDETSLWRRTVTPAKELYEQTPEEIRSAIIDIACDAWQGERSQADLEQAVRSAVPGATPDGVASLVKATIELWEALYNAANGTDQNERAAAAIACYLYDVVG